MLDAISREALKESIAVVRRMFPHSLTHSLCETLTHSPVKFGGLILIVYQRRQEKTSEGKSRAVYYSVGVLTALGEQIKVVLEGSFEGKGGS